MTETNQAFRMPADTGSGNPQPSQSISPTEERTRMRDFFRFGKNEDERKKTQAAATGLSQTNPSSGLRPASPMIGLDASRSPGSPSRNNPYGAGVQSASSRTHSPASSMIFERNVQEDVAIPQASPQIPSHIITENHIPPALDATSDIITDRRIDPDAVEIVTHAAHQPAAVTITESHDGPISPVLSEERIPSSLPRAEVDNASNYANLDSVDVRRLSFISFADVVHGEHDRLDARQDPGAITSHPTLGGLPRSPSPMRSPVRSPASAAVANTSPPSSVSPSVHEASAHRGSGDLNVETMRQALRNTRSGDLSGFRSPSLGATGVEEGRTERSHR